MIAMRKFELPPRPKAKFGDCLRAARSCVDIVHRNVERDVEAPTFFRNKVKKTLALLDELCGYVDSLEVRREVSHLRADADRRAIDEYNETVVLG
jgi:hypothetical protein